jgi:sialate O-acetylesterase
MPVNEEPPWPFDICKGWTRLKLRPKAFLILAIGVLQASVSVGRVRLPSLVGDNMVLQRDAKIALWGWANPGEEVRINFHGATAKTRTDRKGRWSMSVGPFGAGGPFEMTVTGKNVIPLHNILMGDVWLASGQSNMEFPVKALKDAAREMAAAHFPEVRVIRVNHAIAPMPKSDVASTGWSAVTPESVSGFSAVAYLFGRALHERYHVPIGLIETCWGGTAAQTWMSAAGLRPFPEFNDTIEFLARAGAKSEADYDVFVRKKTTWYRQHGKEDRGEVGGRSIWADARFDAAHWPTIVEPRPAAALGRDFNGFGGVVWLRKEIDVPSLQAGQDLLLHLGKLAQDDITYFNGEKIGATQGDDIPRDYAVAGKSVKAGRNLIAVRLTGSDDADGAQLGMLGPDDKMNVAMGDARIPLAGVWSYQTGPDLTDYPLIAASILAAHPSPRAPRYPPTVLFNGMVNPLTPFRIKGVIWYQGEANAVDHRAGQYRRLFPALIQDWRGHWGYEVPFLFVQLAGFGPNQSEPAEYPWAELREAQSMTLALARTGMATAVDIGDESDIHPQNKEEVAHRLVLQAMHVVYGENVVDAGPTYESMQIDGNRIRIKFTNLGSGLLVQGKAGDVRGFEVAAADGKYVWAQARQDGEDMVVFNESVQEPVSVRYDWSNTPDGNLYNKEGLPAFPFRTDSAQR